MLVLWAFLDFQGTLVGLDSPVSLDYLEQRVPQESQVDLVFQDPREI